MISRQATERVGEVLGKPEPIAATFYGAGGDSLKVLGVLKDVPFQLSATDCVYDLIVCDQLAVDLLLGMDFLTANEAVIDLARGNLTLIGKTPDRRVREGQFSVQTRTSVVIGPHREICVPVWIREWPSVEECAVFEPCVSFGDGIPLPAQLLVQKGQLANLSIANWGSVTRVIPAGLLVGTAHLVDRQQTGSHRSGACYAIFDYAERPAAVRDSSPQSEDEARDRPAPGTTPCFLTREDVLSRGRDGDGVRLEGQECVSAPRDPRDRECTGATRSPAPRVLDSVGRVRGPGVPTDWHGTREGVETNTSAGSRVGTRTLVGECLHTARPGQQAHGLQDVARYYAGVPEHLRCMLPPPGVLTRERVTDVQRFLSRYGNCFVGPDGKVGWTDKAEHTINVDGAKPVRQPPRRLGFEGRDFVEKTIQELQDAGKIRPSDSAWASPVVLVRKKDGSMRLCIDYRRLNELTVKDAYPLPRVDDALDQLAGAQWFNTLDMASGYWQVAMAADSVDKTAFCTHLGLYEWVVMPFGLCNAPATFERLMERVLGGLQWHQVMVYLDDVIAFGKSWEETLHRLEQVFDRLEAANLKLKPSKCRLFQQEVEYLGHVVSRDGVQPVHSKVAAICHWAPPTNLNELRSFLGLAGYYRRFIPDYSETAAPLTKLLKKNCSFEWAEAQQAAFEKLKALLSRRPVLVPPRPEGEFIVDADASDLALGAVLSQRQDGEDRVIAYFSKTLSPTQTRYCTTKKELMAIRCALEQWEHHLMGRRFTLRTDHRALEWMATMTARDIALLRWASYVKLFNFHLEHRPGRLHTNADALSRAVFRRCGVPDCRDCSQLTQPEDGPSSGSESSESRPVLVVTRAQARAQAPAPGDPAPTSPEPGPVPDTVPGRSPQASDSSDSEVEIRVPKARKRRTATPKGGPSPPSRQSDRTRARQQAAPVPDTTSDETESDPDTPARPTRSQRRNLRRRKAQKSAKESVPRPVPAPADPDLSRAPDPGTARVPAPADPGANPPAVPDPAVPDPTSGPGETPASTRGTGPIEADVSRMLGETCPMTVSGWIDEQRADPVLARMLALKLEYILDAPTKSRLNQEPPEVKQLCQLWADLVFVDGILCRRWRDTATGTEYLQRLVPSKRRLELFKSLHMRPEGAHLGYDRVYPLVRQRYFWIGVSSDVRQWLKCCAICQQAKSYDKKGRYPLVQEITGGPMERVAVDISGPWPETDRRNVYLFVLQDYYTKWLEVWAIPNHQAETIASCVTQYMSRYGCIHKLHSDQGREFVSRIVAAVCKLWDMEKTRTTPFAPWSDGMVERCNRTIKQMLRIHCESRIRDWDTKLWAVTMAYNGTVHKSTGVTPFRLMHSRCEDPELPTDLLYGRSASQRLVPECRLTYAEEQRDTAQKVIGSVATFLGRSAVFQKRSHARQGLRIREYKEGDEVWYYYPPLANQKLRYPWLGPFKVTAANIPGNTVKITGLGRDQWVHASALKPVRRTADGALIGFMNQIFSIVSTLEDAVY